MIPNNKTSSGTAVRNLCPKSSNRNRRTQQCNSRHFRRDYIVSFECVPFNMKLMSLHFWHHKYIHITLAYPNNPIPLAGADLMPWLTIIRILLFHTYYKRSIVRSGTFHSLEVPSIRVYNWQLHKTTVYKWLSAHNGQYHDGIINRSGWIAVKTLSYISERTGDTKHTTFMETCIDRVAAESRQCNITRHETIIVAVVVQEAPLRTRLYFCTCASTAVVYI